MKWAFSLSRSPTPLWPVSIKRGSRESEHQSCCRKPRSGRQRGARVTGALALVLLVALSSVVGASTVSDVEGAVGGGTGTYIDLNTTAVTNNGITGVWSNFTAGAWNFPDTSDSDITVNGNAADDKGVSFTPEIQFDFTGLMLDQLYDVYAIMNSDNNPNRTNDIEWGTVSGSLTFIGDSVLQPLTANPLPGGDGGNAKLVAVLLGQVSADGSGDMTLYFDDGVNPNGGTTDRTMFDGVLLEVVPEPGTMGLGLLGFGALAWRLRKHR